MTIHDHLKELTSHVRETEGTGKALSFFIDYIQPIQKYFGGDESVKNINLHGKK